MNNLSNYIEKNGKVTLFFTIFIAIIVFCIFKVTELSKISSDEYNKNLSILFAFACIFIGGLVGFIFAIPKKITENSTIETINYIGNDNLAQVSDWLTKIITALTITNLIKLPEYLKNLASMFVVNNLTIVAIQILIVLFVTSGFLLAYLYTRLYFHTILNNNGFSLINIW